MTGLLSLDIHANRRSFRAVRVRCGSPVTASGADCAASSRGALRVYGTHRGAEIGRKRGLCARDANSRNRRGVTFRQALAVPEKLAVVRQASPRGDVGERQAVVGLSDEPGPLGPADNLVLVRRQNRTPF